jgi:hypothetical protein
MSEQEEVKKSFQVEVERVTTHVFVIDDVNSPEEVEMVAEELLDDGEDGGITNREYINFDVYQIDPKEDIN